MSAAIAVSGGAKADFASRGGYPEPEDVKAKVDETQAALDALLEACAKRAPALVAEEEAVLPLARLAVWSDQERWVRPLEEWEGCSDGDAHTALRSLSSHLLEKWEVPAPLHKALAFRGTKRAAAVPEAAHRAAYAFVSTQSQAGRGDASVKAALQAALSDSEEALVSKAVAKAFVLSDECDPIHALRHAQVAALGAPSWLGEGVCASAMGSRLLGGGGEEGRGVCEQFGAAAILWCTTHADELKEPSEVSTALDFALEMRRQDGDYSLASRTPKTVRKAMEAFALTTVSFDSDEQFMPNPRGLKGLYVINATIPAGTVVAVPYDDKYNGGPGEYQLGSLSIEGRGARPCTVRVAEILSLKRLIYEGKQLDNCLEDRYQSQIKYVQRARQRVSSFWSFTFTYADGQTKYVMLAEVWHLRQGNIIRQAEGPRPRTIPGPEAWYWLYKWCEAEGINLDTWDIYSRVESPLPRPPVM